MSSNRSSARPGGFAAGHREAVVLLSCFAVASCAHRHAVQPAAPVAAVEERVGTIRAVGSHAGFVLIETDSALATGQLATGQVLHCRPPDAPGRAATSDVRVSAERHQTLITADVTAGQPAIGDSVYTTVRPTPAPPPGPGSISSVATAPLSNLSSAPQR